jgi:large subunit ribosomal protein L6
MSRVGRKIIEVPSGVDVKMDGISVTVKGPKGTLTRDFFECITFEREGDTIAVKRPSDGKQHRELHGLSNRLLFNMIEGVSNGFAKTVVLSGVGYRVVKQGSKLNCTIGYSHPVEMDEKELDPTGKTVLEVVGTNKITVRGIDKQMVGQVAAMIIEKRPAKKDPYKKKGFSLEGQFLRSKEGKTGGKGKK